MTSITPAADHVVCVHCGHLDSGTYCSACGRELSQAHKPVLTEAWEHVVADRVQDVRACLATAGTVIARPHRFFRTVLAAPAARAGHAFPEGGAQPVSRAWVQTPVKFFILGFIASLLGTKLTGTELAPWIPGLNEDLNSELTLLIMLGFMGLYGVLFQRTSGRRISTEEAWVFNAYLVGTNGLLSGLFTLTPASWEWLAAVEGMVVLYIGFVLPHVVLPRLYAIGRPRLVVAQLAAGLGAAFLLFGGIALLVVITEPVWRMLGF
jgi:hypothetical protein